MDTSFLTPDGPNRSKQVQDAKDMYQTIVRNAERSGSTVPPYEFLELIGKGAFGRVYKCRKTETAQLVAVKILNIDDADFQADPRERDETVKDFRKEVGILQQLKDFKAKNINMIHDAFDLHSQLWIISDFCTGGSVRTLMRARPGQGLEENFLIPIARELAAALKSVHDIGVIHRDLKCANVYVTEDGRIQLGDFGVVGVMENGIAKRTTIIGTPWYMPREMHIDSFSVTQGYGKEVDIWAYGCTIYEMATGLAPNATVAQHMLGTVLEQQAPRLEGEGYSDDLRDFVAFCLDSDPDARPSADRILMHPYIAGTRSTFPTQSLVALIDRYIVWEHRGGQRTSLFNPGGAAAPLKLSDTDEPITADADDWNFNTSDSFYPGFAKRYSQMLMRQDDGPQFEAPAGAGLPPARMKDLTPLERIQREHMAKSADRGERSLDRIWNQGATPYDTHSTSTTPEPSNDLPLRDHTIDSAPRESTVFIDLDTEPSFDPGPTFNFDFGNLPTVKARQRESIVDTTENDNPSYPDEEQQGEKRETMMWTFPSMAMADVQPKRATMDWTFPQEAAGGLAGPAEPQIHFDAVVPSKLEGSAPAIRPQLKHTATVPLGQFNDYIHDSQAQVVPPASPVRDSLRSLIDLNLGSLDPVDVPRPSTASSTAGSISTVLTSGDPFDLDDDLELETPNQNGFSFHKAWPSTGGSSDKSSLRNIPLHTRVSSLSSTESEFDNIPRMAKPDEVFGDGSRNPEHGGLQPKNDPTLAQNNETRSRAENTSWTFADSDDFEYPARNTAQVGGPATTHGIGAPVNGTASSPLPSHAHDGPNGNPPANLNVDLPLPAPPHPNSLLDEAPVFVVMAELERLMDDATGAFKATDLALRLHIKATGGADDTTSESDGGFDTASVASGTITGDEDGL